MRCLKRLAKRLQLDSSSTPTGLQLGLQLAERSAESDCGCKVSTRHIKSWKLTLEVAFPLTHSPISLSLSLSASLLCTCLHGKQFAQIAKVEFVFWVNKFV